MCCLGAVCASTIAPGFAERLVIISSLGHCAIRRARDTDGDSVIAFPDGCAYRRIPQRWLGPKRLSTLPLLELGSYHAIIACVASGTGIAVIPESVLVTMQHDQVARHPLPKVYAQLTTPLVWRTAERSFALGALQETLRNARPETQRKHPRAY